MRYEDRLIASGLSTLDARRTRGDLIEVFKMIKGYSKVDYKKYFKLAEGRRLRGHELKLSKTRSRLDMRHNFFSQRVVNHWNKLPQRVVEATSVNNFKNRYDEFIRTKEGTRYR